MYKKQTPLQSSEADKGEITIPYQPHWTDVKGSYILFSYTKISSY